ncbi:alpha/beta fold hydrolase [Saccharopolyspora sp. NPDC050642]|uniref:alpha/beta fold hydrolase n=1 Tax=Saccharopolyspora sp. NPDC050642 TaxID=3157099 RepID=UPI0033EFD38C
MTGFATVTDLELAGGPVRLYAAGAEEREPVLLLHGAMLDTVELLWHRVLPALARTHRVYAIDLPKHGGSRPWPRTVDQELCELIVERLLDHLGIERVSLVGHSMGGGISLGFSLHHPERVARAVFSAPGGIGARRPAQLATWLALRTPGLLSASSRYLASSATMIRRSMVRGLAAGAATEGFDRIVELARAEVQAKARHREKALDDWQILAYGPFGMRLDFLPELGRLAVPSLWLRGSDDALVGDREVRQAAAAAPGGRVAVVSGAGHLLPLDRPGEFHRLIAEFLAEDQS